MIGNTIGSYQILAKLGEGGMGEVYRARDSKLKREVAIKVLPADVANDRERLARFQREAEVLASLNHPHIAHVYGIEDNALVMELVEGEDLSQRIARGPIPFDEALPIAKQIAEALEAAHEAGIVHRDLKPANIKVREDGTVKVLDFGLAKALVQDLKTSGPQDLVNSPTITSPAMTMRGVILGTAAYMAPEQAKGKAVDRRADIWAFGCVLYEMLTGKRAFKGDDVTDIITSVMRDTPDWTALPANTPSSVRTLLRRFIEKDPHKRAPHISVARMEIADAMTSTGELDGHGPVAKSPRSAWPLALGIGAAMAVVASALTLILTRGVATVVDAPLLRYSLTVPTRNPNANIAVSPDGRLVAVAGLDATGIRQIWVRAFDGAAFTQTPATGGDYPFWSPDGREIGFFAERKLMRMPAQGGAVRQVTNAEEIFGRTNAIGGAAAWGLDGTILFAGPSGLHRVSADGGPVELVIANSAPGGLITGTMNTWSSVAWPQWLPGQTGFLYTAFLQAGAADGALIYQPTASGAAAQLVQGRARSQVTARGVLVARATGPRSAELRLHQLDTAAGKLQEPGALLTADTSLFFSASDTGVLVYRRAETAAAYQFEWVNASGQPTGDSFATIEAGPFNLSRDGTLLAYSESGSVMVRDLVRGVTTRLVQGGAVEPVLSPDGSRIARSLVGSETPRIVVQPSSGGPAETVYESKAATLVEDWSFDGKYLAANESGRRGLIIALDGKQPPVTYADLPPGAGVDESRFSPDGRWLLYNAAEGGRHEVFMIPLPPTGERWQVSIAGGSQGRWRRDGRAMFYLASNGDLMRVDLELTPGSRPRLGRPRALFSTGLTPTNNVDQYAPNADGNGFLIRRPKGDDGSDRVEVIINWPTLLRTPP